MEKKNQSENKFYVNKFVKYFGTESENKPKKKVNLFGKQLYVLP